MPTDPTPEPPMREALAEALFDLRERRARSIITWKDDVSDWRREEALLDADYLLQRVDLAACRGERDTLAGIVDRLLSGWVADCADRGPRKGEWHWWRGTPGDEDYEQEPMTPDEIAWFEAHPKAPEAPS